MAYTPLPDQETLRKLLTYDPETGILLWRARPAAMFGGARHTPERAAACWNAKMAGKPALNSPMTNGYLHGAIHNRSFLAHRIAWKLATGEEPDEIDHINGDRTDNRIANLSSGTRTDNMRNRGLASNNTSGAIGVYQEGRTGAWYAQIQVNGETRGLGSFPTKSKAIAARRLAGEELGFHPNHGERLGHAMARARRIS